jgi:hypothetical protein
MPGCLPATTQIVAMKAALRMMPGTMPAVYMSPIEVSVMTA